jgi:uncharacterized membrane protein YraQ (UPF0718 family)
MAKSNVKLLKIVNPIIAVLFIGQAASGIFHEAIPYQVFGKVHGSIGLLLVAGVTVHLILNRNWIKANFLKSRPDR